MHISRFIIVLQLVTYSSELIIRVVYVILIIGFDQSLNYTQGCGEVEPTSSGISNVEAAAWQCKSRNGEWSRYTCLQHLCRSEKIPDQIPRCKRESCSTEFQCWFHFPHTFTNFNNFRTFTLIIELEVYMFPIGSGDRLTKRSKSVSNSSHQIHLQLVVLENSLCKCR